jgi:hypothetical protein
LLLTESQKSKRDGFTDEDRIKEKLETKTGIYLYKEATKVFENVNM